MYLPSFTSNAGFSRFAHGSGATGKEYNVQMSGTERLLCRVGLML
ncbi:MAG: hypothetical protein ACRD2X_17620 [Vicinamibacteraceae bacterium]